MTDFLKKSWRAEEQQQQQKQYISKNKADSLLEEELDQAS